MHSGPTKSVLKMTTSNEHPLGEPVMTLGNKTNVEDYYQLAAQEAALARAAVTNESRAHHYAMAAYYTRLAEAKEKLARTADPVRPMPFGK
jgi:hypothetical protein